MIKKNSIWWAYIMENGHVIIKPFYNYDIIDELNSTKLCKKIIKPFKAKNFETASEILKQKIN
jgi:hypothetical protein